MTRSRAAAVLSAVCIFLICAFIPVCVHAEEVTDPDFGYSLDLPEDFTIANYTEDGMSYLFTHKIMPVQLALRLYTSDIYATAEEALSGALGKLSAEGSIDTFEWRNAPCAVSVFSTALLNPGKGTKGWATAVSLPEKSAQLVLLCYAAADKADDCEQFIISVLNSLAIDRGSFFSPGIMTSYAFPPAGAQTVTVNIGGQKITTQIDADDAEAAAFTVECEYAVLKLYANSEKWKEAWQRYYRIIFSDSFSRLKKASFDIYNTLYPAALEKNPQNPDAELVQMLLSWVQNFNYEREKSSSDFTCLPAAFTGAGCDCDSRSLLMCVLLENMGIKSTLFVSREYSHAVFGADISMNGAKITVGEKNFLLGETTAKGVPLGLISQDMSDTNKWLPVILP